MLYAEAIEWLYGTQQHGIKLGLENTRRLLSLLKVDIEHGARFIHVAGTNGKGSVCAMLDALCRAAQLRTGMFTSPHLISFCERIKINGEMIGEDRVAALLMQVRGLIEEAEIDPTFFEITTAIALRYFQDEGADIAILETGMGGRLDATNVVTPAVSVITAVAMDHQHWLGQTLREIAGEKAGIIKPRTPVVSAPQDPEVEAVLAETAAKHHAELRFVADLYEGELGLAGSHQRMNAAVALEALDIARVKLEASKAEQALAGVVWPGRFEQIGEGIVIDGAHNPAAIKRLVQTWREVFGESEKATVILGILRDKDLESICKALLPVAEAIFTVPIRSPRSSGAADLARILTLLDDQLPVRAAESLPQALELAQPRSSRVLITGSLFLAGEALALLGGRGEHVAVTAQ